MYDKQLTYGIIVHQIRFESVRCQLNIKMDIMLYIDMFIVTVSILLDATSHACMICVRVMEDLLPPINLSFANSHYGKEGEG